MNAPKFLVGTLADGEIRWAAVDVNAHHLEAEISDRRFGAYLRPFRDEQSARQALIAVGARKIEPEPSGARRKRWART